MQMMVVGMARDRSQHDTPVARKRASSKASLQALESVPSSHFVAPMAMNPRSWDVVVMYKRQSPLDYLQMFAQHSDRPLRASLHVTTRESDIHVGRRRVLSVSSRANSAIEEYSCQICLLIALFQLEQRQCRPSQARVLLKRPSSSRTSTRTDSQLRRIQRHERTSVLISVDGPEACAQAWLAGSQFECFAPELS